MQIRENIPLAPLTTLGVGGAARYLTTVSMDAEAREAVEFARERQLPLFVLGGGSNLVVADTGFPGVVLQMAVRGIQESRAQDKKVFTVGAGEDWDRFVAHTVARNCAGLECLSGIPGTVGGTPVQNVGAYGQEVASTLVNVEALDLTTGQSRSIPTSQCGFAYRTSRFNTVERGGWVILRASFALESNGAPAIRYADLLNIFGARQPAIAEVREAVLEIRRKKGMVIVDDDPDCRSAGSFFKNPTLTPAAYNELQDRARRRGAAVPSYPALASQQKVPAAWLVEQAGFSKGYTCGRVGISGKHALAIVNRGGATAAEVIALKNRIQHAVREQFGVDLYPEPIFLGFEGNTP